MSSPTYTIHPTSHPRSLADRTRALEDLRFGEAFTDHMSRARWSPEQGWHNYTVEAYAPLQLDPATAVLHYAQEIFEGLKAYRHEDGSVWTFRADRNAARFRRSAQRMAMPELPEADFLESLAALVRTDSEWVPGTPESSLYLRPFMFASEPFLGVRPARAYEYLVIASPVGPYFTDGFEPVSIWVTTAYHRAGPGGTGAAKTGANYAASLLPQVDAKRIGFDQVAYLDASNTNLEEVGTMNLLLVTGQGEVVTPSLGDTVLEGVTRDSVLALVRERGLTATERTVSLQEVIDGAASGRFVEAFCAGTAAVITPVSRIAGEGFEVTFADGRPGPVTRELYQELTDIQYGRVPDTRGWMQRLV